MNVKIFAIQGSTPMNNMQTKTDLPSFPGREEQGGHRRNRGSGQEQVDSLLQQEQLYQDCRSRSLIDTNSMFDMNAYNNESSVGYKRFLHPSDTAIRTTTASSSVPVGNSVGSTMETAGHLDNLYHRAWLPLYQRKDQGFSPTMECSILRRNQIESEMKQNIPLDGHSMGIQQLARNGIAKSFNNTPFMTPLHEYRSPMQQGPLHFQQILAAKKEEEHHGRLMNQMINQSPCMGTTTTSPVLSQKRRMQFSVYNGVTTPDKMLLLRDKIRSSVDTQHALPSVYSGVDQLLPTMSNKRKSVEYWTGDSTDHMQHRHQRNGMVPSSEVASAPTRSGNRHPYSFLFNRSYDGKRSRNDVDDFSCSSSLESVQEGRKKKAKVAADMPRRPLTAYNFFFSEEREIILAQLTIPKETSKANLCAKTDESSCIDDKNTSSPETKGIKDVNEGKKLELIKKSMRQLELKEKEELLAKIKLNTNRILNTEKEGDRVKKSHRKMHGKIPFQMLAKIVGQRWRLIRESPKRKEYYDDIAKRDLDRYEEQIIAYERKKQM